MLKPARIKKFRGLNNVSDPLRLDLGWMQTADNVLITDTGAVVRRDGYAQALACAAVSGAFSTQDFSRLYLVDSGTLYRVNPGAASRVALRTGLTSAPMYWAQVNDQVYYSNGASKGVINPDDTVLDWGWTVPTTPTLTAGSGSLPAGKYSVAVTYSLPDGRETGSSDPVTLELDGTQSLVITDIPHADGLPANVYIAPANSAVFQIAFSVASLTAYTWNAGPDALGRELLTFARNPPPPAADQVAFWAGRMFLMEYLPAANATVVWISEPLGFHLFDLSSSFFMVPGRGGLLAPSNGGLIIGTDLNIHSFDGKRLKLEATYGAVPGWGWATDSDGSILLWSVRGLCAALPFVNLTERQVSVAPGVRAGAALVQRKGQKHFVVALQKGGEAFNQRS